MILLDIYNRIIFEAIQSRLEKDPNGEKKEFLDVVLADFDGVKMHLSNPNPEVRNIVTLSVSWKCIPTLLKNGATEDLKNIYGSMVQAAAEKGYDLTIKFDIDNIPGNKDKFPESVALLKRHLIAAPFKKVFATAEKSQAHPLITIDYRDDEAIYIKGEADQRATVIFSIMFRDADDQVFAKIFLQEFADARRTMTNAPSVIFSAKEAPAELKGVAGVKEGEGHGFVTFVLNQNHLKNADKTINTLHTFRDYLHYHIKCSKAYLHNRMRTKVEVFLQVLNRARPTDVAPKEKKTAAGKTFVRKA